jgi:hypothetical protein
MEKKLFLDLMQICWNILQKSKDGVELFMPTEEFFSVDELFADVPELKKELFEAAERTDNDKLPEFIVYVNNIEEYNEFSIKDKYEVDIVEWKSFSELKALSCNKDIRSVITYPEKKFNYHNLLF